MAHERLTDEQIVRLAQNISAPDMETIALGYLDMNPETVVNRKVETRGDFKAFNRDILRDWSYKNEGPDQVKVT